MAEKAFNNAKQLTGRIGLLKRFCNPIAAFCKAVGNRVVVANEEDASNESLTVVSGGIEEVSTASNEADSWYRLSGYGDYPHPYGLQRLDQDAAKAISNQFNSAVAKLKRTFGIHRPAVYLGHPDDPAFPQYVDSTVYGQIDQVEARDDGLYAHVAWSNEWQDLKQKGKWRFSPRWVAKPVSTHPRIISPYRLLSVGLTENPNLQTSAFANSTQDTMNELLKKALAKLGFAEDRIQATIDSGDNAIKPEEIEKAQAQPSAENSSEADKAKETIATKDAEIEKLRAEKEKSDAAASNERKRSTQLVVDTAIANGKLTPANRKSWETKLNEATDFEAVSNELEKQPSAFKTTPQTGDLGGRREVNPVTASNDFQSAVSKLMKETGKDYDHCFQAVSNSKEGKALLDVMKDPSKKEQ